MNKFVAVRIALVKFPRGLVIIITCCLYLLICAWVDFLPFLGGQRGVEWHKCVAANVWSRHHLHSLPLIPLAPPPLPHTLSCSSWRYPGNSYVIYAMICLHHCISVNLPAAAGRSEYGLFVSRWFGWFGVTAPSKYANFHKL